MSINFKIKSVHILVLLFAASILFSCNSKHYYQSAIEVPAGVWHYDSLVHFVVPINDSSAFYRIAFKIKHSQSYPYANLWIKVISKCPCGAVKIDTVNLWFIDAQNRFVGTKIGNTWTIVLPFQDSVKFPNNGDLEIFIQHIMRKNDVNGISQIGIIVDQIKK